MNGNDGSPLNIVRNHRYIVTVVGVNGPGYESPDIAVASAPSNALKVELTDEDTDLALYCGRRSIPYGIV